MASSGTIKKDLLAGLTATETKTVSRILINLQVFNPVTNALNVDRSNVIDVGIGVCSKEAFDLETLPDMDNEADYPQAGWVYIDTQVTLKYADSGGPLVIVGALFKADIRGQRKVDRGVLYASILNVGVNGADSVEVWGRIRALCLT